MTARFPRLLYPIANGAYRLSEPFVGSKVDRRSTGHGMTKPDGLPKGARIRVQDAPWLVHPSITTAPRIVTAPWLIGSDPIATSHKGDEWVVATSHKGDEWVAGRLDDVRRLFDLLAPDTSLGTWLDVALDNGKFMHGCGDEVLLHLLATGSVTKEQILEAVKAVELARER